MKTNNLFFSLLLGILVACADSGTGSEGNGNTSGTGNDTDKTQSEYVHASGIYLFDANSNQLILKGVGLGGWMVQEGYMLKTSGPQHKIRAKLESAAGTDAVARFYDEWLDNYITENDIRQIADWGYNSVRLPLHYELFFNSDRTWAGESSRGIQLTDKLLSWCTTHGLYVILDLHAAPGGQGNNQDICDRRDGESLWEDETFRQMTVTMWSKLAERYATNKIIAGYDLLNEPNYDFNTPQKNQPLTELYKEIIDAIRTVDGNHLLILEGNDFGSNYDDMEELSSYDPKKNLAISFHNYWGRNTQDAIQSKLDLRSKWNVPLWRGEIGENSNSWFTEMVELCDRNKIGWANWPWKKYGSHDGPVQIVKADGWDAMADYLSDKGPAPAESDAQEALRAMIEAIKLENCRLMPDVAYAWIDLPKGAGARPYASHSIPGTIHITDYDMGKYGQTWYDTDYQNTTGSSSEKQANKGAAYRNDGVDIWVSSKDTSEETNGYFVGEIKDGEWMQYTLQQVTPGTYKVYLRYRSNVSTGRISLSFDGKSPFLTATLPGNGNQWTTTELGTATVPSAGTLKIKAEKGEFDMTSLIFEK